jgi:hypothetical protein
VFSARPSPNDIAIEHVSFYIHNYWFMHSKWKMFNFWISIYSFSFIISSFWFLKFCFASTISSFYFLKSGFFIYNSQLVVFASRFTSKL